MLPSNLVQRASDQRTFTQRNLDDGKSVLLGMIAVLAVLFCLNGMLQGQVLPTNGKDTQIAVAAGALIEVRP